MDEIFSKKDCVVDFKEELLVPHIGASYVSMSILQQGHVHIRKVEKGLIKIQEMTAVSELFVRA